ncbi:hypothetical protein BGZ81_007249 [Podila clonocystis]|nr:hypothetical protein BGZ81_007249 [Podila clonocystis]
MTGRLPSGQNQQTPYMPACRPAPAYASVSAAATFPHHSAIQHGQEGPLGEKSWEAFYTLPKRTPVNISKPEESSPSQAMELPTPSSHTTSDLNTASVVLPCSNPVLSSSVFLSSPEMTPTIMSSASTPPESDFSHKIKAESVDSKNGLVTFDPTEHQPGATDATTVQQPDAFPKDQDQNSSLEKISETNHEPFLLRAPIGDGFWAVLALYVERDLEAAQNRFSDLEGRLISNYRNHTPQELGELVGETVKDEKEEIMD